ncbi:MAG TPA: zf-HC2 domain-containing protein [Pseudonocardia sp.]|jgi:predicted anti-sigma-YlaC factor YlaD|nr:zf-HC2 domain-containing protein [Pseudonocardia sp.]
MGCSTCREHLSADLDGEADPVELPAARRHLADCAECTRWFADAALVNRLIRTAPAEPAPGLTEAALTAALTELPRPPSPHRRIWHWSARAALAAVGAVQAVLGALGLVLTGGGDPHMNMMGADMAHMSHESAAWNLALGVAFVAGALWTRHLAGTIPVLGSFVLVLALVSVLDLVSGNVDPARVSSHGLVVVGLGLIVLIMTTRPTEFPRPSRARPDQPVLPATGDPAADLPVRPVAAPTRPDPAARHRAA